MEISRLKELSLKTSTKIVLVVIDGLGDLPRRAGGKTPLEEAKTPHLDELASQGICGLSVPVSPGITPGSGPSHLSLFGYDPWRYEIGRGALAAAGIGFSLQRGDLAARINFATIDNRGIISDRRAGRIPTEKNAELCQMLSRVKIPGIKVFIRPVKEHRAVVVFRGEGLSYALTDSDPQKIGLKPREVKPLKPEAEKSAGIANDFIAQAKRILKDKYPANMVLLRGFAQHPQLSSFGEIYKLNPAAIATYPMYRGIARFVGMEILKTGESIRDEFETLRKHYGKYDFFYLHIKASDSAGEDGDFERKLRVIEEVDGNIPLLTELKPEVGVVTGDHSTPCILKSHSWHPVPFLLSSPYARRDRVKEFGETSCQKGALGRFSALEIMPLALAHALKLAKYGA